MSKRLSLLAKLYLVLSLGFILACQPRPPSTPSILVVVVDGLSSADVTCDDLPESLLENDGLSLICEHAVRFTHAFTPSTAAVPALASLLTARYPQEHGVSGNAGTFLSAKWETVAELAKNKGYATSLISGGAPVWTKTGLQQGFLLFDDAFRIGEQEIYRPFDQVVERWTRWFSDVSRRAFFSVLFAGDLQYPRQPTRNRRGEPRRIDREGQLAAINDGLSDLVRFLRDRRRWANTYFVLAGLNGRPHPRRSDRPPSSILNSDMTQVALLIKPASRDRDQGIHWKIDPNVSLVDVGATLFELIGAPPPQPPDRPLEVTSLIPALLAPDVKWNEERHITVEEPLVTHDESQDQIMIGLRRGNYFIINDDPVRIYNSLIDPFELGRVNPGDPYYSTIRSGALQFFDLLRAPPTVHARPAWWVDWHQLVKAEGNAVAGIFSPAPPVRFTDGAWASLWALLALEHRQWEWLLKLGEQEKQTLWMHLARLRRGLPSRLNGTQGCSQWLQPTQWGFQRPTPRQCDDTTYISLLTWINGASLEQRDVAREEFLRAYRLERLNRRLLWQEVRSGFAWGLPWRRILGPSWSELHLALPGLEAIRSAVERRLQRDSTPNQNGE